VRLVFRAFRIKRAKREGDCQAPRQVLIDKEFTSYFRDSRNAEQTDRASPGAQGTVLAHARQSRFRCSCLALGDLRSPSRPDQVLAVRQARACAVSVRVVTPLCHHGGTQHAEVRYFVREGPGVDDVVSRLCPCASRRTRAVDGPSADRPRSTAPLPSMNTAPSSPV